MVMKTKKKGAKWFVCATAQDTDLTLTQFQQLPWVELKHVGNDGEFGVTSNVTSYATLAEILATQQKGTATGTQTTLEFAAVYDDPGQIILKSFSDPNNMYNMAICYQQNNAPSAIQTKSVSYTRGVVANWSRPGGGDDDFELLTSSFTVNQVPIEQDPTTGAAPTNVSVPVITGTASVGEVLSASDGTWSSLDPGVTYAYQWKDDDVDISGATESTYTLTASESGGVITVEVTATNSFGDTAATSAGTAAVS